MILKELERSDADAILEIETLCFKNPYSYASITTCFSLIGFKAIAYVENDRIIGYITWMANEWDIDILRVAVCPEYRRQGIATKLLNVCIDKAKNNNAEQVFLEVRTSNLVARAVYESIGFKQVGLRKKYYENTEDAIVMSKLLKG